MDLKLLATDAGNHLALGVCSSIGKALTAVHHKRCSDGEYVPQILENIRDTHTVLVCPTSPPSDHNLMDALILGDAIVRAAPARFTMVFPYWGYNRQDRKDKPRVPLTAKLASDMVSMLGPDNVLLFDVHSEATLGYFAREVKVDHLVQLGSERGTFARAGAAAVCGGRRRQGRRAKICVLRPPARTGQVCAFR